MRRFFRVFCLSFSIAVTAFALTGCLTTRRNTSQYSRTSPMVSATLRRHDEQITNLTFQVNQLKESNTALVGTINKRGNRVARLAAENNELKKRLAELSLSLKNEKTARKAEMNALLKEVAKQTAAAVNAAARARSARAASAVGGRRASAGPVGKGEFYVYTVERGATLGAIAKAYKVSVSDIKRANRLSGDTIRVGQKLYIPKK